MESVHELAALPASPSVTHLELVQDRGQPAEIEMVRCPSCNGLRPVSKRISLRVKRTCLDCRKGEVVYRADFYEFWTQSFTMDEIREMGRAIWG
jgi:hypothetical protein